MSAKRRPASLLDDYHLLSYDEVDSTNEEARRLARGGASHGAVIWARRQNAGRGRMDRPWVSQEGNLFVSLLLKPEVPLDQAPQLSFVTSLAAAETLNPIVEEAGELRLKWPNDILFQNKKMGGVLIESEPAESGASWIIVGFGLNIECFPGDADVMFPATCLKAAGIEIISAKIVLSRFLSHFVECYDRWIDEGFEPIRRDWLSHAWRLGKPITIARGDETEPGIFKGIDETGRIELKSGRAKPRYFEAGDVSLRGIEEALPT